MPVIKIKCICGFEIPTLYQPGDTRLVYCSRCKGPATLIESTPGTPADISRLIKSSAEYNAELVHAEVEAMDWPEVIGE